MERYFLNFYVIFVQCQNKIWNTGGPTGHVAPAAATTPVATPQSQLYNSSFTGGRTNTPSQVGLGPSVTSHLSSYNNGYDANAACYNPLSSGLPPLTNVLNNHHHHNINTSICEPQILSHTILWMHHAYVHIFTYSGF